QDLIRGIKKIVGDAEPKAAVKETVVIEGSANVAPLLERAFMFLEDGNWEEADVYCEKVLDQDPKNAQAYLGKLMAELRVRKREGLKDCAQPFDGSSNYQKAVLFGDDKLETEMHGYISHINERNENARLTDIYNNAVKVMNVANEAAYKSAAEMFKTIPGFKDADTLVEQCLEKADTCRKDAIYEDGKSEMAGDSISNCEEAIKLFESISGWKDAGEQIFACRRKIEEIKAKEEADRLEAASKAEKRRIAAEKASKKQKMIIAIVTPIVAVCVAVAILVPTVIIPSGKYNSAMELYNTQKYEDAYKAFNTLSYKDSSEKAAECLFLKQKAGLTNISVGSTIKFGFYEQDNSTSNGKEEIEWKVLAVEGKKALIISQYALDCKPYNKTDTDMTWEKCTLRTWLNGTFYDAAFGMDYQKMIVSSTVTNSSYKWNIPSGNNTTDKVFLLSKTEVYNYFSSDSARQCQGTAFCYVQGANKASDGNCWWWLRSPGSHPGVSRRYSPYAMTVNYDGSVDDVGSYVDRVTFAVRPALWINLGS
nr:DUF6273 domain-containing protein [Clostridia bacterium]